MSQIKVDTITDEAGTGAPDFPNGLTGSVPAASITGALNATGSAPIYACRAWVNFNGTGTVAIRGSGNVSSITDNGVGDYTVNFTTAMPDANYSVVGITRNYNLSFSGNDVITTTAVALQSWTASNTSGGRINIDSSYNFVSIFR